MLTLTVVFNQFDHIAISKKTTHPILLLGVLQNTIAFKYTILKLTYVKIAVSEYFLTHSM